MEASTPSRRIRFGKFEVDVETGELFKDDRPIRLQGQPVQILLMLLEKPGRVVTREELQQRLWPKDTFVDFEHSLNAAIKRLREALDDSAGEPRFIETLPRRGYRFIAPIEKRLPEPVERPVIVPFPSGDFEAKRPYTRWKWMPLGLFLLSMIGVGITWYGNHRSGSPVETVLIPIPLTTYPGAELTPSFSPDGTQVAFVWNGEKQDNFDIYIKQIGLEQPFRLTSNPADDFSPAWSPDGQFIAFLRMLSPTNAALMLIPQRGGQERKLGESDVTHGFGLPGPYLSWTPDSKGLILPWAEVEKPGPPGLFLFSIETEEKRRLTTMSAGDIGDTSPALSPDGRALAFIRRGIPRDDICLLRLGDGYLPLEAPERITVESPICLGVAWTSNGSEIVFSGGSSNNFALWRMAAAKSAKPRRLAFVSEVSSYPAISRQGNRLAYVAWKLDDNIWKVDVSDPGHPVRLISSTQMDEHPAYSPDGKRIAFISNRSGKDQIFICDGNGSNPLQLTSVRGFIFGPRWSPDGQNICFTSEDGGNPHAYTIRAEGGVPRRLTANQASDKWPYWSRDGQSIYFVSTRSGSEQIWKMPAGGGEPVQITPNGEGRDIPQESPDGKFVYYQKGGPFQRSVWKAPVGGGEETRVLDSVHVEGWWAIWEQGIYFFKPADENDRSDMCLYEFATGKTRKILTIEQRVGENIAVSSDGRKILYAQYDLAGYDLMLVENFH